MFFTHAQRNKTSGTEGERRNAAERRVAGREVSARVVPNGFGFGLARTVLRPSARRSRAVQRRPREAQRSGTTGRSLPNGEPAGFFTGRLATDRCQEEDGEYGHGTQRHVTMEHAGETNKRCKMQELRMQQVQFHAWREVVEHLICPIRS